MCYHEMGLVNQLWLLMQSTIFYHTCAFVLLSSTAAAGSSRLLELGVTHSYQYTTTVLLNEANEQGKNVGYQITGDVDVAVVWSQGQTSLIQLELIKPRLLIKSRKAPAPEGFIDHTSDLDSVKSSPFLVEWSKGTVQNIYVSVKDENDLKNLKKGIASLFQLQTLDMKAEETDVSGVCQVRYQTVNPQTILKTKENCQALDGVPYIKHSNKVFDTYTKSKRSIIYSFSTDLNTINSIKATESHVMNVKIKTDAGLIVSATQELVINDKKVEAKLLKSEGIESAIKAFEKAKRITLQKDSLFDSTTSYPCSGGLECPSMSKLVKENRENLQDSLLGSVKSASAFIKLVSTGRASSKDELTKALKGSKNKEIRLQLSDLAGALNTPAAYEVFKKSVKFEKDEDLDAVERFLWAFSTASNPNCEIMQDLFTTLKNVTTKNEKLQETLVLTLTAIAHRKANSKAGNVALSEEIKELVVNNLQNCKNADCKTKYLRALRNLKCPTTLPILMKHALKGGPKTSVEAMKAIYAFDKAHWTAEVVDTAQRIYFEAGKKFDSSSRTLAVDILLESTQVVQSYTLLKEIVATLLERDRTFEVKQYLAQRLQQIASEDSSFRNTVDNIFRELHEQFNNYNVKALRGLTTAFTRYFVKTPDVNGSLVTVQEVSSGLLKRGIVDIRLAANDASTSLFTLGLFAGGLSSFVSSSSSDNTKHHQDSNEEEPEEEVATAGMELTVLGTGIRPFVFFSGQSELMGHVWSGTASEKTPAFQALILTHDHLEFIHLQNGVVAQLQLLGAVSFDLSGQIQISLWNRNAHSLVEQNAGVAMQGSIRVDTSFVKSQVEFNVGTEVKLNLISDLSFYNDVSLCMQLEQPDAVMKQHIHKIERISGSKHKLRKSKYRQTTLPGKSYTLNQKNNDMCNKIFKQ